LDAADHWRIDLPDPGRPTSIPCELHSAYERGPFKTCTGCSRDLADGCLYQIQKVVRGKETVFEMAICQGCGMRLYEEFSEESLEALKSFFLENFKPSPECSNCHFCGFPRPLAKTYTIVGICQKALLIMPPLVLCDRCSESLQARISKKTRDVQDNFIRSTFPGVPADLDVLTSLGGLM